MKIKFQETEIHYSIVGEGETTVLLHGFLESSEIWEDFLPGFSKYGRIICIDLPGHGKSGVISEVHSMELMAEAVYAVLQATGVKKGNIIGHSMGGYVALAFLEQHPEMVQDLMLLNSTPQADSEEKKEIRDRSVELVQRNKKAYITMAINNLLSPRNTASFSEEIDELKDKAMGFPTEGITAALKGMKIRSEKIEVLKNYSGQKIIVAGSEDPLVNISELRNLAEGCGCKFFQFSGGHLSYIENREQFRKLCISSKN
ncbi:alpha/beta hydrolase [Salinimicrobium sp. MT39]|uniref:Alpha/beta hydrolase n=1 Tax=Salinimicrobium profundisediminis TaxID=2994553 RepID=A0A9X3I1M1_9FLAO|nr:alpha/beta hydrolase [Salinimicrobium profundisediminis]MCX2838744.1 alpha/beta hydrolase [Salinimicrobium profundisediminis]